MVPPLPTQLHPKIVLIQGKLNPRWAEQALCFVCVCVCVCVLD
jgi:hypothetical protein